MQDFYDACVHIDIELQQVNLSSEQRAKLLLEIAQR